MAIAFGTQKQISADDAFSPAFVRLTATTGIVAWFFDDGVDDGIKAVHATLAGGVITLGAEAVVLNGEGNLPRLARLTDTSAMFFSSAGNNWKAVVLTVSGTTITVNTVKTLTDTSGGAGTGSEDITALTSTSALVIYSRNNPSKARILTVSGTTITENASFTFAASSTDAKVTTLTSTKVVVTYKDPANSFRMSGQVLDISGTTITGNTVYEYTTTTSNPDEKQISATALTSTKCFVVFVNSVTNLLTSLIVDESATVLTPGALQNIELTDTTLGVVVDRLSTTSAMIFNRISTNDDIRFYQISISGTTITISSTNDVVVGSGSEIGAATLSATIGIAVWDATLEAISAEIAGVLGLAAMTKPASIDAAGEFIYVALLEGGTPILTKISTALDADGTTVFNPGAGDNIGVECGRSNSDVVWVAGNFDGTNVIEKSEDGGSSFAVKDDGTIGDIRAFVMGPDSDDKILVFDETNGDILETRDNGASWDTINASVTPEVNAIARLGQNVEESVFGNQGAANDNVDYSVNSGSDLEDFNLPVNENVTRVIVN